MTAINLGLRFIVELVAIAAVSYWGFTISGPALLRIVLGMGAPVLLIAFWTVVVAPNAENPLSPSLREAIGTVVLLMAAGSLVLGGQPTAALAFGAVVVVNWVLLVVLGSAADATEALAAVATARR